MSNHQKPSGAVSRAYHLAVLERQQVALDAERAKVAELQAKSDNYFALATDRFIELKAAEAKVARLREIFENAPHSWGCAMIHSDTRKPCNCWKAEALTESSYE